MDYDTVSNAAVPYAGDALHHLSGDLGGYSDSTFDYFLGTA